MTFYPIVLYPDALQLAWQQWPGLPELMLTEPTQPAAPAKIDSRPSLIATAALAAIATLSLPFSPSLSLRLLTLGCASTLSYAVFQRIQYRQRRRQWRQAQQRYEKQLETYQRRHQTHQQLCGEMLHPMAIAEYQHELVLAALKTATDYDKETPPSNNSEILTYFRPYLEKYFPGKIKANLAIYKEGCQDFHRCELAYIDDLNNLFIDIEIDEPYDSKTRHPTHCQSNEVDGEHNDFFLSHGWSVIRFSEAQIVNTPRRCCRRIAQEIYKITFETGLMNHFSHIPELEPHPQWTWQDAKQMAQYGSRDADLSQVAANTRQASTDPSAYSRAPRCLATTQVSQ